MLASQPTIRRHCPCSSLRCGTMQRGDVGPFCRSARRGAWGHDTPAAGAAGERLPWSVGALSCLAGARWQTARDRWDDPGTHGSAGALSEAVREIESKAGEVYRSWMEGAEGRAREATRRDALAVYDRYRGGDWDRLKRSASEERMEQVRKIDGEQAYEKMMRAVEKADQEKARQVERARQPVRTSQFP